MSTSPAQALLLEDDREDREVIAHWVGTLGLDVLQAENPRKALSLLAWTHPAVAVIDLDMSKAERTGKTVEQVLATLYRAHGTCTVVVYSANIENWEDQAPLTLLHPGALFHSKRDGEEALVKRIESLMQKGFGDLVIRRGAVIHVPSGRAFTHRIGFSLVMSASRSEPLSLTETERRAKRRFNEWLAQVGSQVRAVRFGWNEFELKVIDLAAPTLEADLESPRAERKRRPSRS